MKLTGPQIEELRKLSYGKQSTYGSVRCRLQNTLEDKKLARFTSDQSGNLCEITDEGRAALVEIDSKSKHKG